MLGMGRLPLLDSKSFHRTRAVFILVFAPATIITVLTTYPFHHIITKEQSANTQTTHKGVSCQGTRSLLALVF